MIKSTITLMAMAMVMALAQGNAEPAKVYFTSEITPDALVQIFQALGVQPEGKVAVKISTGESSQSNQLKPELIGKLVQSVDGTLVECNTAYRGNRSNTASHRRAIAERGYETIATVDLMDEEGSMTIPMQDSTYFNDNIVGSHLANYDFMINLAHFKGHAIGGFGGVIKNQSIGVSTPEGKLDKACLDLVFNHVATNDDDNAPLVQRIDSRHGTHTVDYAEQIGLGTKNYELLDISDSGVNGTIAEAVAKYNVYDLQGIQVLTNASDRNGLDPGTYIVNGHKTLIK